VQSLVREIVHCSNLCIDGCFGGIGKLVSGRKHGVSPCYLGEFWSAITLCAPQQVRFYDLSIRCQAFFCAAQQKQFRPTLKLPFRNHFSQKSQRLPGFPEN
jgi:hypothetical protein